MILKRLLIPATTMLLIVATVQGSSSTELEGKDISVNRKGNTEENVARFKRAPLLKLPLLAATALVGKKALLIGGAAVGAKALVGAGVLGAGVLGAGLYKAKQYNGGYGAGYASYHSAPSYVESSWR